MISAILLIIITIFIPPIGVYCVAGCGADLLINIALTLLGYFPGHIHAFYVEYVYYHRKEQIEQGRHDNHTAPGVYSSRVQTGGYEHGYGTMQPQQPYAQPHEQQYAQPQGQQYAQPPQQPYDQSYGKPHGNGY